MPKQTFFNLPDEKRMAILDVAIVEFAENDYQSASISRMVARLGIAKGSFYQYFEDKNDLYAFVLDLAMWERLTFVQQHTIAAGQSFFEYVQELLEVGMRFDLAHPYPGRIVYRALFGAEPIPGESRTRIRQSLLDYQRQVLRLGVEMGEIAPDVNIDLAAHMLNAVAADFGGFIAAHFQMSPEGLTPDDMTLLRATFAQATRILRYGLSARPPANGA
jgi:AcrR family transcriptional regulator